MDTMARPLFFFAFVFVSLFGHESSSTHDVNYNRSQPCFPACPPLQCTGIYGPRVGPQERWTEVAEWVKKRAPDSFVDERIVMAPGEWGYQVTATAEAIKQGEVLLRLPLELFFFEEDCFPTEAFKKLGTKFVSSLSKLPVYTWNSSKANGADFTQAGLCLLVHRLLGNHSPYETFIKTLPLQASDETYIFRNFSDFDSLRGTNAYRVASALKTRYHALLDQIAGPALRMLQEYFPSLNWTEDKLKDELQQTYSLFGARSFHLDSDMLSATDKPAHKLYRPAMVPLFDLFNHGDRRKRNCEYYFVTGKQEFQLQATRDIEPGEELLHHYGSRSNAQLLLFYGFMMPENIDDNVAVADLTEGAIEYNFHSTLGRSLRCFTPYFLPIEGSKWPPSYLTVIENASANENATTLQTGPLYPSVFRSFQQKLAQRPHPTNLVNVFRQLAAGNAMLKFVDGEFEVSQQETGQQTEISSTRGNLTVELSWKGSPRPSFCKKPKCEDFVPGVNSVKAIVSKLKQGLLPALARVGGCLLWSERRQDMYEIKLSTDGEWTGVAIDVKARKVEASREHQAHILRQFQFKRQLIRAAGLQHHTAQVFRKGVLPETLASIRITVLPELSSFAIHQILSGKKLSPELEGQVARTLGMFCFEELTRRLQALGVDTEIENLSRLLEQTRSAQQAEGGGSYAALARSELGIMRDFCSGIADWELSLWD